MKQQINRFHEFQGEIFMISITTNQLKTTVYVELDYTCMFSSRYMIYQD